MKEKLLKKLNAIWQPYMTKDELALKLKKKGLSLLNFPYSFYGNQENYFIIAFKQKIWIVKHNMIIGVGESEENSEALILKTEPKFVFYLKEEFEEVIKKEIVKYQEDLEKLKNGLESLASLDLPKRNWRWLLMSFLGKNK